MLTIKVDSSIAKKVVRELKTNQIRQANRRALKRAGTNVAKVISQEVRQQKLVKANAKDLKDRITLFDRTQVGTGPLSGELIVHVKEKAFRAQRFFPRRTRVRKNGRVYRGVKIRVLGKTIDTGGFTIEKGTGDGTAAPQRTKSRKVRSSYRRIDSGTIGPKQFVVKRKNKGRGDSAPLLSIYSMSLADIVRFSNVQDKAIDSGYTMYVKALEQEVRYRVQKLLGKGGGA